MERDVRLPSSSRLTDKVMEYYLKFGKDRKLEKFMRFHSPSGSLKSRSTNTISSSSSNDDWSKMGDLKKLFHEEEFGAGDGKVSNKYQTTSPPKKEHIVPIEIETRDDEKDQLINQPFGSPKTPVRSKELLKNVLESETPESVAKSHKRLEWDSLADVGYQKSKSTSNISIVERMLLREFYEVTVNTPRNTNSSESDIRLLEQEIADLGNLKKQFTKLSPTVEDTKYGTPPLASSTHIEKKVKQKTEPKPPSVVTTMTTLQEKFEKSVQISSKKEPNDIDIGTSTSSLEDKLEKSAHTSYRKDPNAFDVGTSTSTLEDKLEKSAQTSFRKEPNAFDVGTSTSTLEDKLEKSAQTSSRKEPNAFDVGTSTSTLENKFEKSAQTSFRRTEMASQGVQVALKPPIYSPPLGSSAEQSSFEYHSKISSYSSAAPKSYESTRSKSEDMHPYAKEINEILRQGKSSETKNDSAESELRDRLKDLIISCNNTTEENKENFSSQSTNSTVSNNPHIDLGIQLICGIMRTKSMSQRRKKRLVRSIVKRITKIANSSELDHIVSKTAHLIDSTTDDETINEAKKMHENVGDTQQDGRPSTSKNSEMQQIQQPTMSSPTKKRTTPNSPKKKSVTQSTEKKNKKKEGKSKTNSEDMSASTVEPETSSSTRYSTNKSISPKSLPAVPNDQLQSDTRKLELGLTNNISKATLSFPSTDPYVEESPYLDISLCVTHTPSGGKVISAMITQPEKIEDVQSKKEATVSQRKCLPESDDINIIGAMQEWLNPLIQSEVEYEEKKRSLGAIRKESTKSSSFKSEYGVGELSWIDSEIYRLQNIRKFLIKERKSAGLEKLIQQDTPSTQDSEKHYDTVYSDNSQKEKSKDSSEEKSTPTKNTQKVNTKERKSSKSSSNKKIASPKRSSKSKSKQKAETKHSERSKIDTPLGSTLTESVESFVRQRKLEFLEHYKNLKLDQYEKMMKKSKEFPSTSLAGFSQYSGNSDGPYSAPAQMQFENRKYYYTHPPTQKDTNSCYYEQALAPAKTASKRISSKIITKTSNTPSSELSVPMGSYNTSSSTTTHQYDLAIASATVKNKADTGSQTGHSLVRSKPIYETRCRSPKKPVFSSICKDVVVRSTGIQVMPKGISYSLIFSNKPENAKYDDNSETNSEAIEEYKTLDQESAPSLQKALMRGNPEFLKQVNKRKSILNRIQKLRQERKRKLREIADENMSLSSLDKKLERLPPPVTGQIRLFQTKQMKAMTNKRVAKLPEVLAIKDKDRDLRFKRSNRLLRELYNRRLRDRVRGGNLNLNHSLTLI